MKRIFNNKAIYTIFVILFFILSLGKQSFAIEPKDVVDYSAKRIPHIIYYNLEWCIYMLAPVILVFIVTLILKLKSSTKNKKFVSILLVISIICLAIIGIEFAIHDIDLEEIIYFFEFKN